MWLSPLKNYWGKLGPAGLGTAADLCFSFQLFLQRVWAGPVRLLQSWAQGLAQREAPTFPLPFCLYGWRLYDLISTGCLRLHRSFHRSTYFHYASTLRFGWTFPPTFSHVRWANTHCGCVPSRSVQLWAHGAFQPRAACDTSLSLSCRVHPSAQTGFNCSCSLSSHFVDGK